MRFLPIVNLISNTDVLYYNMNKEKIISERSLVLYDKLVSPLIRNLNSIELPLRNSLYEIQKTIKT